MKEKFKKIKNLSVPAFLDAIASLGVGMPVTKRLTNVKNLCLKHLEVAKASINARFSMVLRSSKVSGSSKVSRISRSSKVSIISGS